MQDDPDGSRVSEAVPAPLYAVPNTGRPAPVFQPRERFRKRGVAALSNTEVLALILGDTSRSRAEALLRRYGLGGLASVSTRELRSVPGLGTSQVYRLKAVFEMQRRLSLEKMADRVRLTRPADVFQQVRDIGYHRKEHLVGLYLDAQNGLIHRETLSVGSLNTTRTHPREILYPAIEHLALGFILAHNHPSGSLDPSDEDIEFTRGVQRAGETIGIDLYDHVIVAGGGFTSLRERGAL